MTSTTRALDTSHPAPAPSRRRSLLFTLQIVLSVTIFTALFFTITLLNSMIGVRFTDAGNTLSVISYQGERFANMTASLQANATGNGNDVSSVSLVRGEFDDTLQRLASGGQTTTPVGTQIVIPATIGVEQHDEIDAVKAAWEPIDTVLQRYADRPKQTLATATRTVAANSAALTRALDQLSASINRTAIERQLVLSNVRNILTALSVLTFVVIVASLLAQVRESQDELLAVAADEVRERTEDLARTSRALSDSTTESETIMDTVSLGLFLMDPEYRIRGRYSKALEDVFRVGDLHDYNVLTLMQRLLTERMFYTTRDFFTMLFDRTKKQRTLLQVNPLREIEVNFPRPDGGYESRYLSFTFRRILDGGSIARVFVSVDDITEEHRLQQELKVSEQRKERQFDFLLGVLHIPPESLDEFMTAARGHLAEISGALRSEEFAGQSMLAQRERLNRVYASVHSIKGHASMVKLAYFVSVCADFEGKINVLRNRSALSGDDFLTIVLAQSRLQKDIEELQEVRDRFVGLAPGRVTSGSVASLAPSEQPAEEPAERPAETPAAATTAAPRGGDDLTAAIAAFAGDIAAATGKAVDLDAEAFDTRDLPANVRAGIRDVLVQLTRNAVVHGIETPADRHAAGKPPRARIRIQPSPGSDATRFAFSFRDDGRGFDSDAIRQRALADGLITAEQAATMSKSQIVGLIFRPGFTTADAVSDHAGRGVGMSIIKSTVVQKLHGQMRIASEPLKFTEFFFEIPRATPVHVQPDALVPA